MLSTSTIPQSRPRPGQEEFTGYSNQPAFRPRHLFRARDIVCTVALLALVALAFLIG